MSKLGDVILRNTRGNQPAAGTAGRLYYVTDENVLERDSGVAWENVEGLGGGNSGILIYDDNVFVTTGTAVHFNDNLTVVVTGSSVWINGSAAGSTGTSVEDFTVSQGRLTLLTATPVTTSNSYSGTSVYFSPYMGNTIGLYDGVSTWSVIEFSEISLSLAALTGTSNYDIWVYNNSGTATLDYTIWTNNTTRATALALQDGIYVKNGDTTRRYVGTIRTTTTGQCEDSETRRFLWNYYNRRYRNLYLTDATSHTYAITSFRAWNNDANVRLQYVVGLIEDTMECGVFASHDPADNNIIVAIAFDSTTTAWSERLWHRFDLLATNQEVDAGISATKRISTDLSVGYHSIQGVETVGGGTTTFYEIILTAGLWG